MTAVHKCSDEETDAELINQLTVEHIAFSPQTETKTNTAASTFHVGKSTKHVEIETENFTKVQVTPVKCSKCTFTADDFSIQPQ